MKKTIATITLILGIIMCMNQELNWINWLGIPVFLVSILYLNKKPKRNRYVNFLDR